MGSLIIGGPGCSFSCVALTISQAEPELNEVNIRKLMQRFETPLTTKNSIERKLSSDGYPISGLLEEILREWRARSSNDATVSCLLLYLKVCKLKSHADALRMEFKLNETDIKPVPLANQGSLTQYDFDNQVTTINSNQENINGAVGSNELNVSHALSEEEEVAMSIMLEDNANTQHPLSELDDVETPMIFQKNSNVPHNGATVATTVPGNVDEETTFNNQQAFLSNCLSRLTDKPLLTKISIAVIIAMVVLVASFAIMFWRRKENLKHPTTPNSLMVFQNVTHPDDISWHGENSDECKEISLPFQETTEKPFYYGSYPICLLVQSSELTNWSTPLLFRTDQVVDITIDGCTKPPLLISVLQQFHLVKNLTILNENGTLCAGEYSAINDGVEKSDKNIKIALKNLLYINVVNITNNVEVFRAIATMFIMPNVIFLKINRLKIHNENIFWVRKLLKQIRFSVEILDVLNVSWEKALFNDMKFKVTSLYELRIDSLCQKMYDCNILGDVPSHAPILRNLTSYQGYLSLTENDVIMQIKGAEYLKYNIRVRKHDKRLNITTLTRNLKNLKHLSLFVSFEDANNCQIAGKNGVGSHKLTINSDCMGLKFIEN